MTTSNFGKYFLKINQPKIFKMKNVKELDFSI